jgi:hypothetical protein
MITRKPYWRNVVSGILSDEEMALGETVSSLNGADYAVPTYTYIDPALTGKTAYPVTLYDRDGDGKQDYWPQQNPAYIEGTPEYEARIAAEKTAAVQSLVNTTGLKTTITKSKLTPLIYGGIAFLALVLIFKKRK